MLRQQAVAMYAQGRKVSAIARELGRSRQWVHKWLNRHEEGGEQWNVSHSTAPHSVTGKISENMEALVVEARLRLEQSPYCESGAQAIWHDLRGRGITPPSVATINRILARRGLINKRERYVKSDIDYPDSPLNMQIMDLVGPRYLRGGCRFFLLDIISNDTRHAGVYPILSKSGDDVTRSVVSFWKSYSIPDFLQLDNELSFKGSNRHPRGLGILMRTALSLGVTPRFIPVSEPWRNGVVERFNQKVAKTLLMQRHDSFEQLQEHAAEFMRVHNDTHHYSTLGQKTPAELDKECTALIRPLTQDYEAKGRPALDESNPNRIDFIRLVRSDLTINVLNTDIKVNQSLMYSYIEAVLLINEHMLVIKQDGKVVQTEQFLMPVV